MTKVVVAVVLVTLLSIPLGLFLCYWREASRHRRFMAKMRRANDLADTAEIYRTAGMLEEAKAALAEAWQLILEAKAERDGW